MMPPQWVPTNKHLIKTWFAKGTWQQTHCGDAGIQKLQACTVPDPVKSKTVLLNKFFLDFDVLYIAKESLITYIYVRVCKYMTASWLVIQWLTVTFQEKNELS